MHDYLLRSVIGRWDRRIDDRELVACIGKRVCESEGEVEMNKVFGLGHG